MQRPGSSTSSHRGGPEEQHCVINMYQLTKSSPQRRRTDDDFTSDGDLPIQNLSSRGGRKKAILRIWASKRWIHAIPVIVFLSLFILWLSSYPVNVVIKDGRIVSVHRVEVPRNLNNTHLDLTILATAVPTDPPARSSELLAEYDESDSHPIHKQW